MKMLRAFMIAGWVLACLAVPAEAGPAVGAIAAVIKGSVVLSALAKMAVSMALSRLAQALAPKPKQPGIKTEGTASGSQNPASFIFGFYATDGVAVCPPMSHGTAGKTPNAYLTYVIELSDIPGAALNALIINGERCTLGGTAHADYGYPVTGGTYDAVAWVKYYDGTQTVVDPMLLAKYAAYPERPWSSDMVGEGICYAICTFKFHRKRYHAFPAARFEMLGHPLYDPRKDTTVGGSGSHRLATPATWERTVNPIIQAYNAHLGATLPGGQVWGGNMPQADIPLAYVFAAANACDALVDNGLSGTEPRFRSGFEVFVDDEPAGVCEELLKACLGAVADVGGSWRFQAGDPDLPVYFLTDDDFLVSLDREKNPFPSVEETSNGITASYPDPAVQWEPTEAPPVFNATWEAEDGGRRRVVNVDFPAVPYAAQVQRNMRAMIADDRRFVSHALPLPPEATVLDPLDGVSWTSDQYGYSAQLFEVISTSEDLRSGIVQVNLRERDADDTAVPTGYFTAVFSPSMVMVVPDDQDVPSFAVSGVSITDASGVDRRPALELTWEPDLVDVTGIQWEVRVSVTGVVVARGSTQDVATGSLIVAEGILASTDYEARAQAVVDRPAVWTSWTAATTPDTLITRPDVADGAISDQFQLALAGPYNRTATPNHTILGTLTMGAIPDGAGWHRFAKVWIKAGAAAPDAQLDLERRKKEGGVWSSWTVVASFTALAGATTFDQQTSDGTISGAYDDYEYRWNVQSRPGSGSFDWLYDIWLTLTKVTK